MKRVTVMVVSSIFFKELVQIFTLNVLHVLQNRKHVKVMFVYFKELYKTFT